jgi:hypothetical protein
MNGMNGINGHAPAPPLWQEACNADGRVYYYNTITKATQWTKPEDLMTPAEVSFSTPRNVFLVLTAAARSCKPALEGVHS